MTKKRGTTKRAKDAKKGLSTIPDMTFASVSMDKVGDYFEFKVRVSKQLIESGFIQDLLKMGSSFAGGLIGRGIKGKAEDVREEAEDKAKSEEELLKLGPEPEGTKPEKLPDK